MQDTKSLKALLKVLRENGVTLYETPELKLQLEAAAPEVPTGQPGVDMEPEREMTLEERMFYSAPSLPTGEDKPEA